MPPLAPQHFILPLPTFFDVKGGLDLASQEWLIDGVNATLVVDVVLFGSTGEMPALSTSECHRLLRQADALLDPRIRLHLGTGLLSPDDAATLARTSRRPIASLLHYPNLYYRDFPFHPEEYRRFTLAAGAPLTLYHLPKTTGFGFSPERLSRLAGAGVPLHAVKVSQEPIGEVAKWKRDDLYRLWWGSERECQRALDGGAEAIVSQLIAFFPEWIAAGDMNLAQRRITLLKTHVDREIGPEYKIGFLKAVRRALGGPNTGAVLPPARPWTAECPATLLEALRGQERDV